MQAVLGIAARSIDAARQLASALHGPQPWSLQRSLCDAQQASEVPAEAQLLLSNDGRTAFVLVTTHASPAALVAATAALAASAPPSTSVDPGDAASGAVLLTPLQQLQWAHESTVNALLLQLFLVSDAVLVLLPTGQGLGGAGGPGSGGGPLAGASDWMGRLRLLQGAKRAFLQALPSPALASGGAGGRRRQRGSDTGSPAAGPEAGVGTGAGAAEQRLREWCGGRPKPPLLYFVSPSDPTAPGLTSTGPATADSGRDANWYLRALFKRCRPLPGTAGPAPSSAAAERPGGRGGGNRDANAEAGLLCSLDPQTLLLEPGPLGLSPPEVQAAVLAALLEPGDDEGLGTAGMAAAVAAPPTHDGGLRRLRETLSAALTAARGGAGGASGGDSSAAVLEAAWREAAAGLSGAVSEAWREAARQPLGWVPPGVALTSGRNASSAGPGGRNRAAPAPDATPAPDSALAAAAAWLAGGGGSGLAARLGVELSNSAADAALKQYLTATPPRYPARVHAAAVAAAVAALTAAAPPGPAATAAAARLSAACGQAWRQGRQQCSALSVTGRPCTRPPHPPTEPHSCGDASVWVGATTTGSAWARLPDPFDLLAANASPYMDDGEHVGVAAPPPTAKAPATSSFSSASTPPPAAASHGGGRQRGNKQAAAAAPAAAASAPEPAADASASTAASTAPALPAHSRHLVVAMAQGPDGTVSTAALGPWVTVTRLGAAGAYNDRRGIVQPGLSGAFLAPLFLAMEAEGGGGGGSGGGMGQGGRGGRNSSRQAAAAAAAAMAAAAVGPEGDGDGDGGVVLDERSFPSLSAAVATPGRQGGGGGGGGGGRKRGQASGGDGAGGGAATEPAVVRERAAIAKVWPYPHGSAFAGANAASGGGRGGAGGPGAGGGLGMRGRRGRQGPGGGAGGGEGGLDPAAFPALPGSRGSRRAFIAYEYETLDGRRFLATPQQLAAALAAAGTPAAAPAAALAAASPAGVLAPAAGGRGSRGPRGGASAQDAAAAEAAAAAAAAAATAAAAAAAVAAASQSSAAACFLLQHDAPLFLQPPSGLLQDPMAPPAVDGAAAWDPTPRRPSALAQLRRIFIVTPPSTSGEPLLAVRPTVQFRPCDPPQRLPADAAAAALAAPPRPGPAPAAPPGGAAGGPAEPGVAAEAAEGLEREGKDTNKLVSGPGTAAAVVQVSLARPVPLPPDSLVVVALPAAYGLPAEWLGWAGGMPKGGQAGAVPGAGPAGAGAGCVEGAAGGGDAAQGSGDGAGAGSAGEGERPGPGAAAQGQPQPVPAQGPLMPLVQLDERGPYDARLVAGSALFPIPVPGPAAVAPRA
ncbi:hypothetical protein HYH03_005612 [Edaphochlamys debaryana]|uniref:Nonsense-mediated mRNA decay factor SMG8 n=1 Tax=Edaphochlamys debaryana TaxID=47281 RepID=A0A835YEZ5_9CHLO|nr:hypothetical protein HYH03_005612 [Edaphochlamys debaryana]|eukprot:KAG2496384.1 hypothetical protein HYH03_005612 [Edaphochlamys debaryana]